MGHWRRPHKKAIKGMDSARPSPQSRPMRSIFEAGAFAPLRRPLNSAPGLADVGATILLVVMAVAVGFALRGMLPTASLMLIFVVAVLVSAVSSGFVTGILSAVLAFLGYNFFFVEPLYTLRVDQPEDVLALVVFLIVAGLTGLLAGQMREQADNARGRAAMLELLARFGDDVRQAENPDEIMGCMVAHLAEASGGTAVRLAPANGQLVLRHVVPQDLALDAHDMQPADRALRRGTREDGTALGWEGSRLAFRPLTRDGETADIIGYASFDRKHRQGFDREQAIDAIFAQGAMAIERAHFAQQAADSRAKADRETLRSALLSSLSHDLRTPLSVILGSVTSLRTLGNAMPSEARADLLAAIEEETGRLSRYVENLLQMTRLQTGIVLRAEPIDVVDIAHAACERARRACPGRRIVLLAAEGMSLALADAALLEQAIFNLVENAIKFSPASSQVDVGIKLVDSTITVMIDDAGAGIRAEDLAHVFEPFFRGTAGKASGSGLGLAICKAIVEAHGGTIAVESPHAAKSGTRVMIRLPLTPRKDA